MIPRPPTRSRGRWGLGPGEDEEGTVEDTLLHAPRALNKFHDAGCGIEVWYRGGSRGVSSGVRADRAVPPRQPYLDIDRQLPSPPAPRQRAAWPRAPQGGGCQTPAVAACSCRGFDVSHGHAQNLGPARRHCAQKLRKSDPVLDLVGDAHVQDILRWHFAQAALLGEALLVQRRGCPVLLQADALVRKATHRHQGSRAALLLPSRAASLHGGLAPVPLLDAPAHVGADVLAEVRRRVVEAAVVELAFLLLAPAALPVTPRPLRRRSAEAGGHEHHEGQ